MAEPIVIDTNILADVSRGNKSVADALNRYVKSGAPVYISRAAYDELVTRAPNAQMSGQYREMLADMRIQIAPSGAMADRGGLYADNIQRVPAPGQPGQIREYDRKDDPTKPGDAFVAAQAKAIDARLWTLDDKLARRAQALGVKLAPECALQGVTGAEDPVKGRELLGLNPKPIGVNGQVLPTGKGGGGGGGGGGGLTARVGVADNSLPDVGGPSPRGQAIVGGIQLAFQGVNFALNLINDHIQKQKVQAALDQAAPAIARERSESSGKGVLLLFYYMQIEAPSESLIKPGAVFHYMEWGKGATRDEALLDATRTPSISVAPGPSERKFFQEVWLPPLRRSALTSAKCPFTPVAVGRFFLGGSGKAKFQEVEFNIVGGFDDVCERSVESPEALQQAEFAVLKPPAEVLWFNVNGRQTVGVPTKTAKTANGNDITVVDLDPYSPFNAKAAMCFPIDEAMERVFGATAQTAGCRVLAHVNFSMIRWIRAENIHLLRFL